MQEMSVWLLWFGGLNWGLYGLMGIDLVQMVFGPSSFGTLFYLLLGAAAVYNFSVYKMPKGKKK